MWSLCFVFLQTNPIPWNPERFSVSSVVCTQFHLFDNSSGWRSNNLSLFSINCWVIVILNLLSHEIQSWLSAQSCIAGIAKQIWDWRVTVAVKPAHRLKLIAVHRPSYFFFPSPKRVLYVFIYWISTVTWFLTSISGWCQHSSAIHKCLLLAT